MSQAVLGFSRLTVLQIVARTREIADATEGNSNYTTPNPTLIQIRDSATLLESKYNLSRKKGPAATNAMKLQLKAHRLLMVKFLAYIQVASGGDATKIESASLTVKGGSTPGKLLGRVYGLKGKTSDMIGQLILSWNKLVGADRYAIQSGTDDVTFKDTEDTPSKTTVTITNLPPGDTAYYRIAGINTPGRGAYSTPVKVSAGKS